MRRHWKTLALLAVLTPASPLPAATIFTDRAAFEAAAPGLPVEDFENGVLNPSGTTIFPQPLSDNSNNAVFSQASVLEGFSLTAIGNGSGFVLAGPGEFGATSKEITSSAFDANIVVSLTQQASAFGIDLLPVAGSPGEWQVSVFGLSGLLNTTTLPVGGFYGIAADEQVTNIVLDQPATNGFIDNLTFGEPIPEPATVGLLSLAGLFRSSRRQG